MDPKIAISVPVNVYGKAKLAGERAVFEALRSYYIVRAGWMVGGWEIDKKFVYKIVQLCQDRDEILAVDDKMQVRCDWKQGLNNKACPALEPRN